MNRIIIFFTIAFSVFASPILLSAEDYKTAYVSDILILTVRKGPARNFEVFKTIESDEKLIILDEKESFSKVKLINGDIGWVQTQYLTFDTPDYIIIRRLEKKLEKIKMKNLQLNNAVETSNKKYIQNQTKFQKDKQELESILSKSALEKNDYQNKFLTVNEKYNDLLEKSKNVILINKENEKIKKNNKEFLQKIKSLEFKNRSLFKVGMIKWFLSGAGVIFLGWIIGRTVSYRGYRDTGLLG